MSGSSEQKETNAVKVLIARDECVGAGHCVQLAPEVFDQDEDGIVTLLTDSPPPDAEYAVDGAADLCPAQAILIANAENGTP